MFWVISVYFNIRNTLPKSGTFLLRHPVYIYKYTHTHTHTHTQTKFSGYRAKYEYLLTLPYDLDAAT